MKPSKLISTILVALSSIGLVAACSSDDSGDPGSGGASSGGRRIKIGKADLAGTCKDGADNNFCGGKSGGNCWCDTACSQYGDCCSDLAEVCGSSGGASCEKNSDCPTGDYCRSENGCAVPGVCTKIPAVFCPAVVQEYCTCDNESKTSNSGCVFDRVKNMGPCATATCAALLCGPGTVCVNDVGCTGSTCAGQCVPDTPCATLFCAPGTKCVDHPGCTGSSCPGQCVPDETPKNICQGQCGGPSEDKSCYCDDACKGFGDCCADYDGACGARTLVSGGCAKNGGESCSSDTDCAVGGCGGELCYAPSSGGGISTCECAGPGTPVTGCGCVNGSCGWYK